MTTPTRQITKEDASVEEAAHVVVRVAEETGTMELILDLLTVSKTAKFKEVGTEIEEVAKTEPMEAAETELMEVAETGRSYPSPFRG